MKDEMTDDRRLTELHVPGLQGMICALRRFREPSILLL
jgi:hypothetical protein